MSDLVAHLHVKFCTIKALFKHYVLIASRQCLNSVSVKCLGPFFFPYGQFKNAYDQDQDYIHGEAYKQLETCFGFGLVIV